MSEHYEEIIEGIATPRRAPNVRHERICARLHTLVKAGVSNYSSTQLLPPRTEVRISRDTILCPDLALVTSANSKLWLAAEIVSSDDHRTDTVLKKDVYESMKLPRLWMIDPRYDNIEVYHSTDYGLSLHQILAGREQLTDRLLPEFILVVSDLFADSGPDS